MLGERWQGILKRLQCAHPKKVILMSAEPSDQTDLERVPLSYKLGSKLPLWILHFCADLIWPILFYLVRYRRKVVDQNLKTAFPDMPRKQRVQLARQFYRGFTDTAVETIKALDMPAEEFTRRVKMVNGHLLTEAMQNRTQPVIVTTLHMGNWEWMLHAVALHFNTIIDPVYKPLHSEKSERFIQALRDRFGGKSLKMADTARNIVRHRKRFRLVSMVADQAPSGAERAHWIPLFGRVTGFYTGAETLARATNIPLVFAYCRRVKRGYYEVTFKELAPQPIERKAEGNPITELYRDLVEEAVRTQPQDWLWSNRRFKRQPPSDTVTS
jgi:KDO2-lipid IV(A) lauroyltransferase